ncbi:uncharacterized protein LOC133908095 [Phragmites australis]|uniref:uncharacterized protein LOC133908095 n=1 Tax=Phragmites australis TaxID=29695 RepID=UPI002D791474|nr:uncharacterized protein LOC133908095 [Phragmites australis]
MNSLLKATAVAAVVTVLAATAAAASYISTSLTADFLSSPPFLWAAANGIIWWLFSSSRRSRTSTTSSSAGHDGEVLDAVDSLYPLSEYEAFDAVGRLAGAQVFKSKRPGREAKTARRSDRPRARKKSGGEEEPSPRTVAVDAYDDKRGEEVPVTVATAEAQTDDADHSIDSMWQTIVQRRAARPVAVRKSETWASDELPRLQRAAETAVARREMRKSISSVAPPPPLAEPSAARQLGWRTIVMAPDDLLRRAESFIRQHHENLRLQRQESEQRHRPAHALIRV